MPEFNTLVAHFGEQAVPGRIEALEGGRGFMRVALDWPDASPTLAEGSEGVLEMHDGVRFRVTVTEGLDGGPNVFRMKLIGRG